MPSGLVKNLDTTSLATTQRVNWKCAAFGAHFTLLARTPNVTTFYFYAMRPQIFKKMKKDKNINKNGAI